MHVNNYTVTITTAADGTGKGHTPVVNGRILSVAYVKPSSGGFTNGVDFEIYTEDSKVEIWDQDNVDATAAVFPRAGTHTTAGVAAEYSTGFAVNDFIYVGNERIEITVAAGGDGGVGTFHVMVG